MAKYDRGAELKAFHETKAGVKGLVDAGITEIPRIFHHPWSDDHYTKNSSSVSGETTVPISIPVIDLEGLDKDDVRRKKIVEKIGKASESSGFFQIINHGIPESVLEEMKEGVRRFFDQETEVKKELYTRDYSNPQKFQQQKNNNKKKILKMTEKPSQKFT
ncbi:1-aminocyclopropane-1-carboxylate oxidase homolog [Humulus lupulus]|uniref:1-aminocyclopropane-1-carboxylate oxidase homolog n=1 Tax=Humulus lupulus TaxID=3486 RepID=UPI002B40D765|nr:1-aminocyclopropane-1-carboxylate oxidase homolog [Humulus lupulus]